MGHFKREEMARCFRENGSRCRECPLKQPADKLPNGVEENLSALVENVLEPAREKLGMPIVVNSGYRCPLHNARVGGVTNSQHMRGEAADVSCEDNERLAKILEENGRYDQLIRYKRPNGSIRFIHVSWKRNGVNRKQKFDKR
ncbi:MAG: peptidase M15 [Bacteroidaceae bacterium]|nr:peptidase M15 [Bacteroidaceae bacterium]